MKMYIESNYDLHERVCCVGDGLDTEYFGVVVGFWVEEGCTRVLVSFGGNDAAALFESQIESLEERKARRLLEN